MQAPPPEYGGTARTDGTAREKLSIVRHWNAVCKNPSTRVCDRHLERRGQILLVVTSKRDGDKIGRILDRLRGNYLHLTRIYLPIGSTAHVGIRSKSLPREIDCHLVFRRSQAGGFPYRHAFGGLVAVPIPVNAH